MGIDIIKNYQLWKDVLMNLKTVPYFQFPTTVCFIDDDELFAETAKAYLNNQTKINLFYSNPQEVLNSITTRRSLFDRAATFKKEVNLDETDDDACSISRINYSAIVNQVYDPGRFNEIAIFVVDYSMPEMSGLEFCQQIKNLPQKKIMLTGHNDTKMAVEAFNAGLIDKFIVKSFKDLKTTLNATIDDLVGSYFSDVTKKIFPVSGFCEFEGYIKIFETWLCDNNIVEYYRCDDNGSLVGFDNAGDIAWLVFVSNKQVIEQIEEATFANASSEIVTSLRQKKKILFLFADEEQNLSVNQWGDFLFPVQGNAIFNGEKIYYSSFKHEAFSLKKSDIKSFGKT